MLRPTATLVTIDAAGTPERAVSGSTACAGLKIHNPHATSKLYICDRSNAVKATGVGVIEVLAGGGTFELGEQDGAEKLDLADYWIDADANAQLAYVTHWGNRA